MSVFNRLRSLLSRGKLVIPIEPIEYHAIGVVRNRVREPQTAGWEEVPSDILLRPDLADALDAIEGFSHIIVVFHLDRVPEPERRLKVLVGSGEPRERGVLATRSQRRPNPIGVSVVALLQRRRGVLRVLGLDALDGTPVLDLKPYLPAYDASPDATLPPWALPAPDGAP